MASAPVAETFRLGISRSNGHLGMNDFQIEEFLADRFADFVNDAEQRKQGKYYSSNRVFKFF